MTQICLFIVPYQSQTIAKLKPACMSAACIYCQIYVLLHVITFSELWIECYFSAFLLTKCDL